MPITDLFPDLQPDSKRGLARNLFEGFYERGYTANQALQELRSEGLGYRRQDFLSDYRSGRSSFDQAASIRYVNMDKIPTEGILEPKYHGVPDKYSLLYRVDGQDQLGNERTSYFFIHRNTLDTRRAMQDEGEDYITGTRNDSGLDQVFNITLIEGFINPNWV